MARRKQTALERVCNDPLYLELSQDGADEEATRLAVEKTVDMLLGGMKEAVSANLLEKCLEKMQKNVSHVEKAGGRV